MNAPVFVTGGAGFIGSAVVRELVGRHACAVVNIDALTYAANLDAVEHAAASPIYRFEQADIRDRAALDGLFSRYRPRGVMHLAAESHVDRSIAAAGEFMTTNVMGTFQLLEAATSYWRSLDGSARDAFRFHHVSTDEVFGTLSLDDPPFNEQSAYDPRSPYSASKAGSDHLVLAWHHTHGLPVLITHASNNYGPWQFPEKLIPLMITRGLQHEPMPVYGDGANVRDWLHVEDHAHALIEVFDRAKPGRRYTIGGQSERRNIDVVRTIARTLDALCSSRPSAGHESLITFVTDRPGHDFRYAIDNARIRSELGWRPVHDFESGIRRTIDWYLAHREFWEPRIVAPSISDRTQDSHA